MDSRVNILIAAFDHQRGEGFDFTVYQGRVQYGDGLNLPVFQGRAQYGAGFDDVLRGIWRYFRPVAITGAQTLLTAGSKAIKDGATVKEVLSATLKPTIGAVLGATAEQVANRFTSEQPTVAPSPGPPTEQPGGVLVNTQGPQKGSGKRKSHAVYKKAKRSMNRHYFSQPQRPIIYNF